MYFANKLLVDESYVVLHALISSNGYYISEMMIMVLVVGDGGGVGMHVC